MRTILLFHPPELWRQNTAVISWKTYLPTVLADFPAAQWIYLVCLKAAKKLLSGKFSGHNSLNSLELLRRWMFSFYCDCTMLNSACSSRLLFFFLVFVFTSIGFSSLYLRHMELYCNYLFPFCTLTSACVLLVKAVCAVGNQSWVEV